MMMIVIIVIIFIIILQVASSCTAFSTLTSDMQHLRVRILHADMLLKTRELFSDLEASASEKRKSLQTRRKRQTEYNIARVVHRSLASESLHQAWKGGTNTQLRIHQLANEAVDSLARQLDWDEGGVIWFAFAADQQDRETLDLHVLLGDRHAFHLANPWSPRSDLSKVTLQAGESIKNAEVTLISEGQSLRVQSLEVCGNLECTRVLSKVDAPVSANGAARQWTIPSLVLIVTMGAVLML